MTKWLGIGAAVVVVAGAFFLWRLYGLGQKSQTMDPMGGMASATLKECAQDMRCVSSVSSSAPGYLAPLDRGDEPVEAYLPRLKEEIRKMGGIVQAEEGNYLRAEFTSKRFEFVDDLEILVTDGPNVHVRSESRVGKSDLGVNRDRVERLRTAMDGA